MPTWEERIEQYKNRSSTTPVPSFSWNSYPPHSVSIHKTMESPRSTSFNALVAKIADFEKVNKHNPNLVYLKSHIKQLEDNYPIFDHKITSYTTYDFSGLGSKYALPDMPDATIYEYQNSKNNKNVGTTLYLQAPYAVIPGTIKDIAAMEQRFNEDVVVREEIARRREQKASEFIQSQAYKNLEKQLQKLMNPPKFRPRTYMTDKLSVKSDPRLLINTVNNLKKALQRRNTSEAPIGRGTSDFFANILKRGEGA